MIQTAGCNGARTVFNLAQNERQITQFLEISYKPAIVKLRHKVMVQNSFSQRAPTSSTIYLKPWTEVSTKKVLIPIQSTTRTGLWTQYIDQTDNKTFATFQLWYIQFFPGWFGQKLSVPCMLTLTKTEIMQPKNVRA